MSVQNNMVEDKAISMHRTSRIYVAGGGTLIGSAILAGLEEGGYLEVLNKRVVEPDFLNPHAVDIFFAEYEPEYVFLVAGKSGGIGANQKSPASLMYDNLLTVVNVIHTASRYKGIRLLYLASSCSYPKHALQPMKTESLLSGKLEPTNQSYAIAKITGIELCRAYRQEYGVDFISGIPADIFGMHDDFDIADSHVIPALIHKMHMAKKNGAKQVEIWGTGTPRREFMYARDLADACIFVMNEYRGFEPINIGSGLVMSIAELATAIKDVVGYKGSLYFDTSRTDGTPLKSLDSNILKGMGWQPETSFKAALAETYDWFLCHAD
jgi:GDP-L-fucose synthase